MYGPVGRPNLGQYKIDGSGNDHAVTFAYVGELIMNALYYLVEITNYPTFESNPPKHFTLLLFLKSYLDAIASDGSGP